MTPGNFVLTYVCTVRVLTYVCTVRVYSTILIMLKLLDGLEALRQ